MKEWAADFGNDPDDDYNLIVEILYGDEDVAVIRQSHQGLTLKLYPNNKELSIPIDWLSALLLETKKRIGVNI